MLELDTMSWEEPPRMKLERNLNFATLPNDEDDFGFSRKKTSRDPMSHRIIEKRRRDRMNNCLADLSRLVPTNYLKKGRGRIEKTEIIEMAIKHLKHLQAHPCKDPANCEVAKTTEQDHKRQFRFGYTECMNEALRFVGEAEGVYADSLYARLATHLQKHYEKMAGSLCYTQALTLMAAEDSKSHMDVDHSTSDTNSNGVILNCNPPYCESEDLKHQNEHPKVTSQLREMLQNPDVPKAVSVEVPKLDVYKFKNTIKHRFNADVRHHTSSPTDTDRMSFPDDEKSLAAHSPRSCHAEDRLGPPPLLCSDHFQGELSVKTPSGFSYGTQQWDSHAETASSCGSDSSPPPNANGSSSGYSTNGDNHHPGSKMKESRSPTLSPYSRTPDPLPSPSGVPIFALHPKGTFYIPLTVESSLLIPYLVGVDDLSPVLHPISICVNLSGHSLKVEKVASNNNIIQYRSQSSYLMDKFNERLVYAERHPTYYPCPTSPSRDSCT